MKKSFLLLLAGLAFNQLSSFAQQNVGIGTATPNASAKLDVSATNKGILIPRVNLTSLTDVATVPTPATGLMVYNTNAALSGGVGFYYNEGTTTAASWTRVQTSSSAWSTTGNANINGDVNFIGTTDANPLIFKVNNIFAGGVGPEGGVGLGRGVEDATRLDAPGIIAIGDSALFNNADSSEIAIGQAALYNNDVSGDNVAIGNFNMVSNTTGNLNTSLGNYSLATNDTAYQNVSVGYGALFTNESSFNTAVGTLAMESNYDGDENVALGCYAMDNNISGFDNTASGFVSLYNNTNGFYNVATGCYSMFSNTTGQRNTANGPYSLYRNTTGNYNTAMGRYGMFANTTGSYNIGIGHKALATNTTGSFNTAIGDSADVASAALTNATAIGFGAIAAASNSVRVGNAAVTSIGGQVGWSTLSDGRFKKNVSENVKGLDFIMKLRPVTYFYDFEKIRGEQQGADNVNDNIERNGIAHFASAKSNNKLPNYKLKSKLKSPSIVIASLPNQPAVASANYQQEVNANDQIRYTGFIAQEVEATAKSVGFDFSGVDKPKNENDHYALRYAEFVVPLVKAVQEQQALINKQQELINELTKRIEKLENK
jgi:hypothetical protein